MQRDDDFLKSPAEAPQKYRKVQDSAKPKSAFVLSSLGKYQFNRVPFGLAQAPAYFQKLINDILKGCNFAMGYLDDIIIYSQIRKRTLRTPRRDIHKTENSRTKA